MTKSKNMIAFTESLTLEVETALHQIHSETLEPIHYAQRALHILIPALAKLKSFFIEYHCSSKTEEITFFRELKPKLVSKLVYYNDVYNITANKPLASKKAIRKYYKEELQNIETHFNNNKEFYRYYRMDSRHLDEQYFTCRQYGLWLVNDSFYTQADERFATAHDHTVARIMANALLEEFIGSEMAALGRGSKKPVAVARPLKWTASKAALIELIYALHAEAVFNGGKADLSETVRLFEAMFQISLGQFNRAFLEIRNRKSPRTKFLSALTQTLLTRMDAADEK
jgi:hypothetical protein